VAAFERVAGYWYMLPEYKQARKAIWDAINPKTGKKRIDEAFPHEIRKATRNQEMMIEFVNGSNFQVVGSDNPNSLVGAPPAGIVYSEWALSNPDARAYLRPILLENDGWQIFNTTPRGRNHAFKTLQSAQSNPESFGQVLDATQTGVFTEVQLERELRSYIEDFGEEYGRAKFEQEYLCSFDAATLGAILARQIALAEKQGRISDTVTFDKDGADIQISSDIGRRDAATWWFWQPQVGGYQVVDYAGGWGADAEEWCDKLSEKLRPYRLGKIWLPHDARAKTFAAKRSAVEIFVSFFGADKVGITPEVKRADRVNAARVLTPRVKFNKSKCERGLAGLRSWQYEYNDETKTFSQEPLHDWASHDGDGYSYGCVVMQEAFKTSPDDKPKFFEEQSLNELWENTEATQAWERRI
jgi:phage terminase large subunit